MRRKIWEFRHRRQWLGLAAFISIIVALVGGMLWLDADFAQRVGAKSLSEKSKIERKQTPELAQAPKADPDQGEQKVKTAKKEPTEETVAVPDIPYNATEQEAKKLLESKGLKLGKVKKEPNEGYEKGGVFYQDPLPGKKVKPGDSVGITLSSDPKMIGAPDVPYNATEQEAKKLLESKGLKLGEVKKKPNEDYEKGGVFYQDPLPGVKVKKGGSVGITLSSDAKMISAPDIPYNATEQEAKKLLESKGLKLGKVKKEPNGDYEKGGVFYQDPLPGKKVKPGDSVGITLSSDAKKVEKKRSRPEIPQPTTNDLYLTVPRLGLYDNYVSNTENPAAMDSGAIKLPVTAFPWQPNGNTYIAAHRVGYSGTPSYNQFYALPSMQVGDQVILSDANGTTYTYQVSDVFAVTPQDSWVTAPVAGRDMVTLQTCVASVNDWWTITSGLLTSPPGPGTARLVVQADRVDVQTAS